MGKVTHKKADKSWHESFLVSLRENGNVSVAAKAAGVLRKVAYQQRANDPEFAAAWEEAIAEAIERLEDIARKRAERTSDTLLIFLLKAHKPSKYRDNVRVEHSGPDGKPIEYIEVVKSGDGE